MASFWFFLTDPGSYHLDQLFRRKKERWDGVLGTAAQKYLGEIRKGDRIIGYHTAPEKVAYAVLEAVGDPYQNPELKEKNQVIDVRGVQKFSRPVPLAELKASPKLRTMKLLKLFRPIAVSPL
ncbi:MAG: EVE domain-containing protein, partial [Acidobacteriota bacterium]|nr:EVE domain-containing protein [Acidobacteriota bacterium]